MIITSLNLDHNEFGPEGAASLASSPNITSFTSLNLGWNRIGDEGAALIGRMLNCKVSY